MEEILKDIENIRNSEIKEVIDNRVSEFKKVGERNSNELFNELCFCLLTANFSASGGIKIQNEIGDGFIDLPENLLAQKLAELGHRFPNARAKFIFEARRYKDNLKDILNSFHDERTAREWLVKNIKGLGMKEASHFLRNIGYENVAIIDFHILDLLSRYGIIEKPKTMSPKKYIEIENELKKISDKTGINLGELDLYLWYKETGKILK